MLTCMWPSWCHCHSLSLASVKSRLVLPFWYQLTRVVPDKGPLNGCVCVWVAGKTVRSSLAHPALSALTASQTQHEEPYEGPVCFTLQYITNYESAVSSTLLRCRQTKYQLVTNRQTLDNYLPRRGVGRCRRRADCCTHWTMSDEPGRQSHTHTQPLWLYLPLGLKFQTRKF